MHRCVALTIVLMCVLAVSLSGCGSMRELDQWKCDNFGWCPNGTVPSWQQYQYQYPYQQPCPGAMVAPPAAAPCCPPTVTAY